MNCLDMINLYQLLLVNDSTTPREDHAGFHSLNSSLFLC